jgi:hypothetical protein
MTALLPGDEKPSAFWHISAAAATKKIDCTLHGITSECGAACCKGLVFWPPKATGTGVCAHLGPAGCMLGADRPISCLLYPFRLVGKNLVLHVHANVYCQGCYKAGDKMIVENNRPAFALLFGEEQADIIIQNARAGHGTTVGVKQEVLDALKAEQRWEAANAVPLTRQGMLENEPPPAASNSLTILQ